MLLSVRESITLTLQDHADQSLVGPRDPVAFKAAQKELARDLVIKEQQIELLISHLPGLSNSEGKQEETIQRLEAELVAEEEKRKEAVKQRDVALANLEKVIRSIKRPR